jgi:hypothetical protein
MGRMNSSEESDVKGRPIRPPDALTSGVPFAFSASTVARRVVPATQGQLSFFVDQNLELLHVCDCVYELEASVYFLERGVPLF